MVVWCPDWPVVAAGTEQRLSDQAPVAVVQAGQVLACSPAARLEGVRRGMRRRDASATCPELILVEADESRDVRAFETVLAAVEDVSASVTPIRPGLCALAAPRRFYGGEAQAAAVVAQRLVAAGVWDCRLGIAEGMFAAEQAARRAAPQELGDRAGGHGRRGSWPICRSASGRCRAGQPAAPAGPATAGRLRRLVGPRRRRPGSAATAPGCTGWLAGPTRGWPPAGAAPLDLSAVDQFRAAAGHASSRSSSAPGRRPNVVWPSCPGTGWSAPPSGSRCSVTPAAELGPDLGAFALVRGSADIVDRLYWQLQADPLPEPAGEVRLVPELVESLADHGDGLWGSATDNGWSEAWPGCRGCSARRRWWPRASRVGGPAERSGRRRRGGSESSSDAQPAPCPGRAASRRRLRPGSSPNHTRPRCSGPSVRRSGCRSEDR